MKQLLSLLIAGLLLTACASNVPQEISARTNTPSVAEVRSNPQQFTGSQVRWGGTIVSVTNRQQDSVVEIVARDLGRSGRPLEQDSSPGRFLAQVDGFLDPAIYAKGREMTVSGTLTGAEQGKIGEHAYNFPLVSVTSHYLWEKHVEQPARYYDPFWYDPWYRPYYYDPFYWPYYRRHPYYW